MPIHISTQDRPMAILYSPPIKANKHESTHTLPHEICKKQANKALRYYNGKPKIKGKWHLHVGSEIYV